MLKQRIYVRAAQGRNGKKVDAHTRPRYEALQEMRDGAPRALPTVHFALDVEIPDEILNRAERAVATVAVEEGEVAITPLTAEMLVEEASA